MKELIKQSMIFSVLSIQRILEDDSFIQGVETVCNKITEAFHNGKKVLVFGNGGSAADAQHIAGELVSRFKINRTSLPAIALTTDSSVLTAIGNDFGFEYIFEKQIEGLANKGDIVIGISTSGNSKNISRAFKMAKQKGAFVIGLLGRDGGENKAFADKSLIVPGEDTPRIQESHILVAHIICEVVEKALYGEFIGDEQSCVS